jgi:hypothetical protein
MVYKASFSSHDFEMNLVGISAPNSSEKLNGMTKSLPGTPPNIKSKICVNVLRCEDLNVA